MEVEDLRLLAVVAGGEAGGSLVRGPAGRAGAASTKAAAVRDCRMGRVPGVTNLCSRRCLGSSLVKAAITAQSAQSGVGRAT
jgi:hypothetical protein